MVKSKYVEMPSITRTFDGESYRRVTRGYSTKYLAQNRANKEREKGYNARVVRFTGRFGVEYYVYTRRRKT